MEQLEHEKVYRKMTEKHCMIVIFHGDYLEASSSATGSLPSFPASGHLEDWSDIFTLTVDIGPGGGSEDRLRTVHCFSGSLL